LGAPKPNSTWLPQIDDRAPPEEIVKMKDYLMNNVSPDGPFDTETLRSKIETTTGVDHDTADKLLNLSVNMSESATAGAYKVWNESMWRSGCYDATFFQMSVMFGSRVFSVLDTPWRIVDFGEDKCLYGKKPDYTSFVNLESTLDGLPLLSKYGDEMEHLTDEDSMPFLVVEAKDDRGEGGKSGEGGKIRAENQCALSAVKLLFIYKQLGLCEAIACITLVGNNVTIYLASWRDKRNRTEYIMQPIWVGFLPRVGECVMFHIILYRLFKRADGDLRNKIVESLGTNPINTQGSELC